MGIQKMKKPPKNKKVDSLTQVDYSEMRLPLVCVYNKPLDFQDKIIARVWEACLNAATNVYAEYDSLEECRTDIKAAGFNVLFPRSPADDIHIVESYFR